MVSVMPKPSEFPNRDEDFDLDALNRLHAVELRARRVGWTPDLIIARANLELTIGNLDLAEATVTMLRERVHDFHETDSYSIAGVACPLCDEADFLSTQIADERKRPLADKKDYSKGWSRGV